MKDWRNYCIIALAAIIVFIVIGEITLKQSSIPITFLEAQEAVEKIYFESWNAEVFRVTASREETEEYRKITITFFKNEIILSDEEIAEAGYSIERLYAPQKK